ncbi:MAG: hypothetical protein ACRYFX_18815 [Janthinobacterium lividum]
MLGASETFVAVLLRCTCCHGELTIDHPGDPDEDDTITRCLRCEYGTESAAVPVRLLFDAWRDGLSDEQIQARIAEHIASQQPVHHSLLRHAPNDLAPRLLAPR